MPYRPRAQMPEEGVRNIKMQSAQYKADIIQ